MSIASHEHTDDYRKVFQIYPYLFSNNWNIGGHPTYQQPHFVALGSGAFDNLYFYNLLQLKIRYERRQRIKRALSGKRKRYTGASGILIIGWELFKWLMFAYVL